MASVQNILNTAAQYLGTSDYNNFCEAFVEQATQGHTGTYPSAIQAWLAQQKSAVSGTTKGIQPGDTVYFSANEGNGGYGHTGIYVGNNQFISATNNGVQTQDLSQWQSSTGQQLLGYVPSGQFGRGVAQFAMSNGEMLQNQMTQTRRTPDPRVPQLLQQFKSEQQIAQSERLVQQKQDEQNQLGPQANQWSQLAQQQQLQQQKNLQPTSPTPQATPVTNQAASYPYAQFLAPTGQPTMPGTPPPTPMSPTQNLQTPATI